MKVKVVKEIEAITQNEENENLLFGVLECGECRWKFIGDCERHGYGFTVESTDTPNFCPMCGSEIEGVI